MHEGGCETFPHIPDEPSKPQSFCHLRYGSGPQPNSVFSIICYLFNHHDNTQQYSLSHASITAG